MALASASLLSTPRTVMYTFVRWASLQQMFDECFLWRFVLRAKWKIDEQLRPRSISSMRWSKRIWKRGPRLGEWQLLSPFVAYEKNIEDAVRRVADAVETIVRASVAAIRPFPSFEKSASPNKNLVRPPASCLRARRRKASWREEDVRLRPTAQRGCHSAHQHHRCPRLVTRPVCSCRQQRSTQDLPSR